MLKFLKPHKILWVYNTKSALNVNLAKVGNGAILPYILNVYLKDDSDN